jgi:hypothetical protein
MDERAKKRFFWGVLLAWIPALPLVFTFFLGIRDLSTSHATGIAAVAGGLAEAYAILGAGLTFAFEVAAIVLLFRSFSGRQLMRSLFTIVSLGCSALILFLFGIFIWLFFSHMPHTT